MSLKYSQLDLCRAQLRDLVVSAGQRLPSTFQPNYSVLLRASLLLTKALNTPSCWAASALPGISWLSTSLAPPNRTTPGTACALRGITRLTGQGWIALWRECLQATWQKWNRSHKGHTGGESDSSQEFQSWPGSLRCLNSSFISLLVKVEIQNSIPQKW